MCRAVRIAISFYGLLYCAQAFVKEIQSRKERQTMRTNRRTYAFLARFSLMVAAGLLLVFAPFYQVFASLQVLWAGPTSTFGTGPNGLGQIGTGEGQFAKTAQEFLLPTGLTVQDVFQGRYATYILASDNQVYGSGANFAGELGVGDRVFRTTPVRFQLPVGVTAVRMYGMNDDTFALAAFYVLGSDGHLYGAGKNTYGQLGNGTTVDQSTPVRFQLPAGVTVVKANPQNKVMLVLGSDGNVYGAGRNAKGELGNGTTTQQSTPAVFQLPSGVSGVDFGHYVGYGAQNTVLIASDSKAYAAGENYYGQIGNGTSGIVPVTTPAVYQLPVGVTPISAIVGLGYTSVVGSDGQLYSAGSDGGMFGNGTTGNQTIPVKFQLPMGVSIKSVHEYVMGDTRMVIGSDDKAYGAGINYSGVLGDGTTNDITVPFAYPLPSGVMARDVVLSDETAIVMGSDGNAYVTGDNIEGQLGTGDMLEYHSPVRYNIPTGSSVTDIMNPTRDYIASVHVIANGRIYGSGINRTSGLLGDGSRTDRMIPVAMQVPSGVTPQRLYAYDDGDNIATCFVSTANRYYCAGVNTYGQFGTGGESSYANTPLRFALPSGVSAVKYFAPHTRAAFVLGSDGQLYGAGENDTGMLGIGSLEPQYTPVRFQLPAGLTVVDVAFLYEIFGDQILVLASDGQVYGAGHRGRGGLGNGTFSDQSTPMRYLLPGGVTATGFMRSKGEYSTPIVLGSDGKAYLAGANSYGQIGIGVTGNQLTPVAFPLPSGVNPVKASTTSQYRNSVLGSDGIVYSAGRNDTGAIGDGSITDRLVPTPFQLPVGLTAVDVLSDTFHTYVLASDGQVYGAGQNISGQLGNGTTTQQNTPVRLQLPSGVMVANFNNAYVVSNAGFIVTATNGDVYATGTIVGSNTPVRFQLPSGVTAAKLLTGYHTYNIVVLGSDGNVYSTGENTHGEFGDGTTTPSTTTPARYQLPSGVTATDGWYDRNALYVLGSNEKLYVAGYTGSGDLDTITIPRPLDLPFGARVLSFSGHYIYGDFYMLLDPMHAIGGQTFCDANDNGSQDSGESLLNAQTVSLYSASGGVSTGPALQTYSTQNYLTDNGVFFFDGLLPGDYILGLTTDTGVLYSDLITVDGSGDGWILGNSQFINTVSAMGQLGHVCGASTVVVTPPNSQPPTTQPPLARTGVSQVAFAAFLIGVIISSLMVLSQRTKKRRTSLSFGKT